MYLPAVQIMDSLFFFPFTTQRVAHSPTHSSRILSYFFLCLILVYTVRRWRNLNRNLQITDMGVQFNGPCALRLPRCHWVLHLCMSENNTQNRTQPAVRNAGTKASRCKQPMKKLCGCYRKVSNTQINMNCHPPPWHGIGLTEGWTLQTFNTLKPLNRILSSALLKT